MNLLLIGATDSAIGAVREAARSQQVDVRVGAGPNRPDWTMTSTGAERADAIRRYGLPTHRVIELRELGTDEGPSREVIRTALVRMSEIGPLPRSRSARPSAMDRCAVSLLTAWSTRLAAGEARNTLAARAAHVPSKDGTELKGRRILIVAPDVQALDLLRGLLNRAFRGRKVHVAITHASPGDPDLSSLPDLPGGLTVGRSPTLSDSPWRPLALALRDCLHQWRLLRAAEGGEPAVQSTVRRLSPLGTRLARNGVLRSWPLRAIAPRILASIHRALPLELTLVNFLEARGPDLLIVVPHRSAEPVEADYVRVARRLGIPTVSLPLRWDDLEACDDFRDEPPDVVAVWNEAQRRRVMHDCRLPAERVFLTGACLVTVDGTDRTLVRHRTQVDRGEYCARKGIDPCRRILLFGAPAMSTRASVARFHEWRQCVQACADAQVHGAAVVVYVQNQEEVPAWRRIASSAGISVVRAGSDPRRAPFRLAESLMAADVVIATDLPLAFAAVARAKPVIAWLDNDGARDSELARFCRTHGSANAPLLMATSVPTVVTHISSILASAAPAPPALTACGDEDSTGARSMRGLLDHVSNRRSIAEAPDPPAAWRLLTLCCASMARRFDGSRSRQPGP